MMTQPGGMTALTTVVSLAQGRDGANIVKVVGADPPWLGLSVQQTRDVEAQSRWIAHRRWPTVVQTVKLDRVYRRKAGTIDDDLQSYSMLP
jgi:hypothetical protein